METSRPPSMLVPFAPASPDEGNEGTPRAETSSPAHGGMKHRDASEEPSGHPDQEERDGLVVAPSTGSTGKVDP